MAKHEAAQKPSGEASAISDPRFAHLHTDPRFIRPKKRNQKVALDERFKGAFDAQESSKGKVDRFGRKLSKSAAQDELRRFYRLEDEEGKKKAGPGDKEFIDFARGQVLLESSDEEDEEEENKNDEDGDKAEEQSDEEDSDEGEVELGPSRGVRRRREVSIDLDEDAPIASTSALPDDSAAAAQPEVQPTNRVAVVNMDWDNLRALDLFKVFSSLLSLTAPPLSQLPPKRDYIADEEGNLVKGGRDVHRVARGRVERVVIYKSQFGKDRMAKEDLEGPPKEIFKKGKVPVEEVDEVDEYEDDDDGSDIFREDEQQDYDEDALRRYQLERLRYYYAIVTLDTVEAARHVYEEVEGSEFERTANVFDLSYVPEALTFNQDDVHEECREERADYNGVDFVTDALRHSNVKLTWDAEDPHRSKVTRLNTQKLSREELAALDYDAYIAPASSDEEEDDAAGQVPAKANGKKVSKRDRMRQLMGLDGAVGDDEAGDMEITFTPALSTKEMEKGPQEETSLDAYKRKEKERRERKKAAKAGPVDGEAGDEAEGKEDLGFEDDFFKDVDERAAFDARDAGIAPDAADDDASKKTKKKLTREERQAAKAEADRQRAELKEVLGSDEESAGEGGRHFNMNDIVKAEKNQGKKRKGAKAKRLAQLKDEFSIDAADERFKSVFDEPEFAIDPSNPHFKKTKNMDKLLETGQKRRAEKRALEDAEHDLKKVARAMADGETDERGDAGLSSLVASLKRRARGQGGVNGDAKRRRGN